MALLQTDRALDDPFLEGFHNEPYLDFSHPADRRRMAAALETVRRGLGEPVPLVVAGERILERPLRDSANPARPGQIVCRAAQATAQDVDRAVRAARAAYESWRRVPVRERVELLWRARDLIRERIFELAARVVFEVGKSWAEAYGDVAEAVDFCDFYGRQMLRLAARQPLTPKDDEEVQLRYVPLGAGAAITPWNFPFAIPCGLLVAPIVAGNTVIFKPASDAPGVGYDLFELLREAGVPDGVCHFLPGAGEAVGRPLVEHPGVRFIGFTGSREVGVQIHERAARVQRGQIWLKRTILEMGGKNATIVCESADLDAAAEGIVSAAFGYQGQKCSACSRAIVAEPIYDALLDRLIERTRALTIGDPEDPDHFMGPVINQAALEKVLRYIDIGRSEGRLVAGGERLDREGHFVQPTIFADVAPAARIAQEEIFGPLLAVIRARDFDEALAIANGTEYGLTGAVYSDDDGELQRAAEEFHVGNLYLNRKCTGALVGCHPFGGFNMSGTDSKTGGRDYLLLFTQAKSIARRRS